MPCVLAHATDTNDIMHASHDMHMLASQPSLDIYDAPEVTCWHAICVSQMTSTEINCFTFSYPR